MIEQLREALNDIRVRVRLMFTRGRLNIVYPPPAGKMQTLQVEGLAGEVNDRVEHAEEYGHASYPLEGAEPFMGAILGQRNQLVALVVSDPRTRPVGLKPGEVCVWSAYGQRIHLRDDGGITVEVPGGDLLVNAPEANVNIAGDANLTAGGAVNVDAAEVNVSAAGDASLTAGGTVTVEAPEVSFDGQAGVGTGARQPVARIGDLVEVGAGSSAGLWPIVTGASDMEAS